MKSKSYYTLFIFYFLIFIFILYLNGVFTGDILSFSNLFINVIFLLLIGILFLISAAGFKRLNQCTAALSRTKHIMLKKYKEKNANLWNEYKSQSDVFGNPYLDEAFSSYQRRIRSCFGKKGQVQSCDIEEFINEDLLDRISSSHFNSGVSGTLTGLGILGTFIGLSLGLSAFSGDDIFTVSDNVGPLLSGMKVAFHTSVYGIFFSLVFNFVYRGIMAYSYQKLEEFLSCYQECAAPSFAPDTDETAKAMLVYQANMANSMKAVLDLMKGSSLEQTKGVEQMVSEFTKQLSLTMGSDFQKLGNTLNEIADAQVIHTRNYQSMENVIRELLEANRSLQQSLEHTMDWQELFAKELNKQKEMLTKACDTINDDITTQLYTFNQMRDLYEK